MRPSEKSALTPCRAAQRFTLRLGRATAGRRPGPNPGPSQQLMCGPKKLQKLFVRPFHIPLKGNGGPVRTPGRRSASPSRPRAGSGRLGSPGPGGSGRLRARWLSESALRVGSPSRVLQVAPPGFRPEPGPGRGRLRAVGALAAAAGRRVGGAGRRRVGGAGRRRAGGAGRRRA